MASKKIIELYKNIQNQMIAELQGSDVVSHPVEKGDTAELNWLEWFEKYLPKRYSVTKGKVIDYEGNLSDQIDIIIYDHQYSPLVFTIKNVTYVAAESVYAVFEVKQELNKKYIEYAGQKTGSVRKLKRTSAKIPYSTGLKPPKELHRIIAGLLTTKTGWVDSEKNTRKYLEKLEDNQELDIICAMKNVSYYAIYNNEEEGKETKSKSVILEKNDQDNILMYLLLTLLLKLQIIGTAPAIEYDKYFGDVATVEEIFEEQSKDITNNTNHLKG